MMKQNRFLFHHAHLFVGIQLYKMGFRAKKNAEIHIKRKKENIFDALNAMVLRHGGHSSVAF